MSPPYKQLAILTPVELLCKSCIHEINNQRCRRKPLCIKTDARKAEHTTLLRALLYPRNQVSGEDRAANIRRFARLSVCSTCKADTEEVARILEAQLQAHAEIVLPDVEEQTGEVDGEEGVPMLDGEVDGQQDGGNGHGEERTGNEEQNTGSAVSIVAQSQTTPQPPAVTLPTPPPSSGPPSHVNTGQLSEATGADPAAQAAQPVITTPTKPEDPLVNGAVDNAALRDQGTEAGNKKSTVTNFLLKGLMVAVIIWVLIVTWTISLVVYDEILCYVFDCC